MLLAKAAMYHLTLLHQHHGYKLCLHLYMNGDGISKGSHLSLFFVNMRGEFDYLLQWPFKQMFQQYNTHRSRVATCVYAST